MLFLEKHPERLRNHEQSLDIILDEFILRFGVSRISLSVLRGQVRVAGPAQGRIKHKSFFLCWFIFTQINSKNTDRSIFFSSRARRTAGGGYLRNHYSSLLDAVELFFGAEEKGLAGDGGGGHEAVIEFVLSQLFELSGWSSHGCFTFFVENLVSAVG